MELKDVKLIVDNPNKEYYVGLSAYSMGYGYENIYTDGYVRLVDEEQLYGLHASVISIEDATYVARENYFDMNEKDINKMSGHSYSIISSDPVDVVEKVGINNIFNSSFGYSSYLSTATVYSKKIPDRSFKNDDFMKLY